VLFNVGLFEVHKLLFSFAMTTKIQEVESSLSHEELDFFIKVAAMKVTQL
jgi:alpha-D-ribose 1-methylphosphonate 5-triphosphate synthase subunit PhnI